MENKSESIDPAEVFAKAREMLDRMEELDGKGNALLLTYDSESEAFQMLSMHADIDEVKALILSCIATMKQLVDSTQADRTLN